MAYTSEIDKLEARWRENPKGRNFAPLADAYRKAGLIDNALILLENGLKLHPDYVSAHIVHARCLIDKKDDAGAQDVFRKVLALDGENIIALRVLAEIAERNSRFEEAAEWLARLLNADPMNGDAAEALARVKGKAATKPDLVVEPTSLAEPTPRRAAPPQSKTPAAAQAPTPPRPPAPAVAPGDIENFDDPVRFNPAAHAAAKAEGLEVQEDVELNPQQIEQVEIEGLARTHYEGSGLFKLDTPAQEPEPDLDDTLPQVDLPLILPEEGRAAPQPPRPPQPPAPPPPPQTRVPAAVALSDDDGAADTATLSKAEPVLTETMAELYLKQGHHAEALRVYQALLAQRPTDARLKSRVEQLSSGGRKGSGLSAQAFLKSIWSGRGAPPPAPPSSATEPQSTLAAAFEPAGPPPGEPSHPAQDHISLDSVFGEEAARRAKPPEGEPKPDAPGGFSFDEFFAGSKPGSESARTPGRSSGRNQRPSEDEADADQFQQWLKKLKS